MPFVGISLKKKIINICEKVLFMNVQGSIIISKQFETITIKEN